MPELGITFGGLYIANNGYDKPRADAAIAQHKVDAVAFGKPFIAHPDLVTRFLLDAPLSQIDQTTLYGGAEKGYTDYPLLSAVPDSVTPFTSQCVPTLNRMDDDPSKTFDQVCSPTDIRHANDLKLDLRPKTRS